MDLIKYLKTQFRKYFHLCPCCGKQLHHIFYKIANYFDCIDCPYNYSINENENIHYFTVKDFDFHQYDDELYCRNRNDWKEVYLFEGYQVDFSKLDKVYDKIKMMRMFS